MKYFITLSSLLLSFTLIAQDFAPLGAKWYYKERQVGFQDGSSIFEILVLHASKDTTVLGKSSKKINRIQYKYDGDIDTLDPYIVYQEADTVYLYDPNNIEWDKLYIFNVSKGDTITLDVPFDVDYNPENASTFRLKIDSVAQEAYGTTLINKFHFAPIDDFTWHSEWYSEKAGGFDWFTARNRTTIPEYPGPLKCYHDIEGTVNPYNYNNCDEIITGLKTEILNGLSLFPNPATNRLMIGSQVEIDKIELISLQGDLLKTSFETQIDVSDLTNGVYMMKIYSGNSFITRQFVKN